MKRILALILSLILCFGFIVSCSKEEEPTSEPSSNVPPASSEPTSGNPASNTTVRYYYHKKSSTEVQSESFETGAWLMEDQAEYINFTQNVGVSDIELSSAVFEKYYVLIRAYIQVIPTAETKTMGYREAIVTENGCVLIWDVISYCTFEIDENGEIETILSIPEMIPISVGYYDVILIPKNELGTEITKSTPIEIKTVTHVVDQNN